MEKKQPDRPFWRQGDIFFVKTDEPVNLAKATPVKTGVIARGETTGHAHRVSKTSLEAGALLNLFGRSLYLKAPEAGATVVHDEHKPIHLPAGLYEVVHQREFDGLGWRQVLD